MVFLTPWKNSEFADMLEQMDLFFGEFFDRLAHDFPRAGVGGRTSWRLSEDETHVIAQIDLPGSAPDDIKVYLTGNYLTVQVGESNGGSLSSAPGVWQLRLPKAIQRDAVQAQYVGGVLSVIFAKSRTTVHSIPILD